MRSCERNYLKKNHSAIDFLFKLKYDTSMMILSDVIDLDFTGSRVPLVIFHPFFMRCTAQTLTKW